MDIENKYEASFDLNPESVENLKDILHSEIEEVSKRFNNGTETLDDLINNYRHLKIKFEMKNGTEQDLDVVELKYYLKLIEKIKAMLNELNKKDKEIEELKDNNKDLLRKLRNRVKEVKKLEKYSLYKKEFATLNKRIEKKEHEIKELKKQLIALTYKSSVKGSR